MFKDKEEQLLSNVPEKWKLYKQQWLDDDSMEPFITTSIGGAKPKTPTSTRKLPKRQSSSKKDYHGSGSLWNENANDFMKLVKGCA